MDVQDTTTTAPGLPSRLAYLADQPELAAAWDHQVAARQAEAAKITALLDYQDRILAEEEPVGPLAYEAQRETIHHAGLLLGGQ